MCTLTLRGLLLEIGKVSKNMILNKHGLIADFEIPSDWHYRGEGNSSVVLSLPKWRRILRIKKMERPTSIIRWLIIWISDLLYWYWGKGFEEELRDVKFYSTIVRPLIGLRYTSEANQVILTKKQIKILEDELSQFRPDFRKNKTLQYGRASLFDDFAFMPQEDCDYLPFNLSNDTFAVEIKPKQGWRPLKERHFPSCLYCMNQYLKLEHKQIDKISNYCPEDLFSGDDNRMLHAIESLIEVPQNNFRIFKNGILAYNQKETKHFFKILQELFCNNEENIDRLKSEFCILIKTCLLKNLSNINLTECCEEKMFCEWNKIIQKSNNNLPKGCVLEKILSIQMLDSEGSNYYSKLLNKDHLKDWDYIHNLLSRIKKNTCLKCTIMMLANTEGQNQDLNFTPYLISAIAKDCSVMITLKKINEGYNDDLELKNVIKTSLGHFLVNLGVFDLYPKPLSTIKKHCRRNENILDAYQRFFSGRKN